MQLTTKHNDALRQLANIFQHITPNKKDTNDYTPQRVNYQITTDATSKNTSNNKNKSINATLVPIHNIHQIQL